MASSVGSLLKQTYAEWKDDQVPRLAAALAYYTAFSLAPLLVIVVAVAGLAFGAGEVRTAIAGQVREMLGEGGAELVLTMLQQASRPRDSILAMAVGVITLLLGASGLFGQLQDALNTVWEVQPRPGRGLLGLLKDRFLSFAMVLGVGFLLLVSLVLTAALQALEEFASGRMSGVAPAFQAAGFVADLAFTTLLIAMIYKFLPDVRLRWSDVWTGSAATAALFTLGKFAIGAYLGRASVGSAYGAAGSLAVVLIWVYYSSQILLFGAELTQVHARRKGSGIEPKPHAESMRAADQPAKRPAPAPVPAPTAARAMGTASHRGVAVRVVEPEVVEPPPPPRAFIGGMALGIVFGFLNDRLRRRFWPTGRWLNPRR